MAASRFLVLALLTGFALGVKIGPRDAPRQVEGTPADAAKDEVPRDDAEGASRVSDMNIGGLVMLSLFALSPVYARHGLPGFGISIIYLGSLTSVTALVKVVLQGGLPYPYTITALHMIATFGIAAAYERPRIEDATKVIPIAVLTTGVLGMANVALLHGGVAFVTMVGTATPVTTYVLELISSRKSLEMSESLAVTVVTIGGLLCVRGATNFNLAAFLFAWGATLCRSVRVISQANLLQQHHLAPSHLTAWMSFWAVFLLAPMIAYTEGLGFFKGLQAAPLNTKIALGGSCAAAVVLNLAATMVIKLLGTLLQNIVGAMQLVLVLGVAVVYLDEEVLLTQWIGVAMVSSSTLIMKVAGDRDAVKAVMKYIPNTPGHFFRRQSEGV